MKEKFFRLTIADGCGIIDMLCFSFPIIFPAFFYYDSGNLIPKNHTPFFCDELLSTPKDSTSPVFELRESLHLHTLICPLKFMVSVHV